MDPTPPYAVLFKTHFWDDFVDSQFRQLQARAGTDELFVVVDETHGPVPAIPHEKVLRITEDISAAEGFYQHPKGSLFWYNSDYPVYLFLAQYPQFKYVVAVEYDVSVKLDMRPIIQTMAAEGLEFVCEHIAEDMNRWMWTSSVAPFYPADLTFTGRLLCIAIFAQEFAFLLQIARKEHSRRLSAGETAYPAGQHHTWPFTEAFIGAEIARLGVPNKPFSAFADMSNYDWWPPYHPDHAAKIADGAIIHPVLAGERLLFSLLRYPHAILPETWLDPNSTLRTRLAYEAPGRVVPALLEKLRERQNIGAIVSLWLELRDLGWHEHAFPLAETIAPLLPHGEPSNIALKKFAYQSSVCAYSRSQIPQQDAGFAVNGRITGDYAFHTNEELNPWWMVDVGSLALVSEIVIFNRAPPYAYRANNLAVFASTNAREWTMLHKHASQTPIGGAAGEPLKIPLPNPILARFIRIELLGFGILHLAQVQVFGIKLTPETANADPERAQAPPEPALTPAQAGL